MKHSLLVFIAITAVLLAALATGCQKTPASEETAGTTSTVTEKPTTTSIVTGGGTTSIITEKRTTTSIVTGGGTTSIVTEGSTSQTEAEFGDVVIDIGELLTGISTTSTAPSESSSTSAATSGSTSTSAASQSSSTNSTQKTSAATYDNTAGWSPIIP